MTRDVDDWSDEWMWASDQVWAAIERGARRGFIPMPGSSEFDQIAVVALWLAITAVECLAEERRTSVEAVLDQLIERRK
jgi:hypothetical protein